MILECNRCEAVVDAKLLHFYSVWVPEDGIGYKYALSMCPKCEGPLLSVEDTYGDSVDGETIWEDPVRIYPQRDEPVTSAWPQSIRAPYQEALTCFKAKAFTASAIMCRKSLEAMCHEHKTKARSLAGGLKQLKEAGVIEKRLFDWAEALRISGNKAAHEVSLDISGQDAKDIIEFTDALLQYVFTFTERFDEFIKRREKAAGKA